MNLSFERKIRDIQKIFVLINAWQLLNEIEHEIGRIVKPSIVEKS